MDVEIKLKYYVRDNHFKTESNIAPEHEKEILLDFLRGQIGLGEDKRNPNERDMYTIRINLDLSDDSFQVFSDTGNEGLTTGLIMQYCFD